MRECFYGRSYHCRSQRLLDGVLFRATLSLLFLPFTIAFKVTSQFFPFLMLASAQLRFYQDFKGIFVKTTGLEFVGI